MNNGADAIPCLILAGATASGKSALAMRIAEITGGRATIINADSMQVYDGLPILTAMPDDAMRAAAPHYLYGMVDGAMRYSVAAWLQAAGEAVANARAQGRLPILVGGTGMYLRAAMHGLAPIPEIPQEVRDEVAAMLTEMGGAAFRCELARQDPELAGRLEDGDTQRLLRGMEVVRATGKPLSDWQKGAAQGMLPPPLIPVLLTQKREVLYDRINRRFPAMLAAGAAEEVRALAARKLDASLPLMKAVGLRPIMAMLEGRISREAAITGACRDTRRLAKRQMTWFRNQYKPLKTLEMAESENSLQFAQQLESFLHKILPKVFIGG